VRKFFVQVPKPGKKTLEILPDANRAPIPFYPALLAALPLTAQQKDLPVLTIRAGQFFYATIAHRPFMDARQAPADISLEKVFLFPTRKYSAAGLRAATCNDTSRKQSGSKENLPRAFRIPGAEYKFSP
jgi:hypothetical protein